MSHQELITYYGNYPGLSKQTQCQMCDRILCGWPAVLAEDPATHPGILGPICDKDYSKLCQVDPMLPWTDPISGRIDYQQMEDDLGVDSGRNDWMYDEEDFV